MSPRPGHSQDAPAKATNVFVLPAGWLCLLIFVSALLAYFPALSAGFIWDDNGHVTRADLRSLAGLGRIWFEIGATQQYYPVLHSAFWLEHRWWGDNPFGYHLLNILLHATSACLFATLLRRLAVPGAALAAFLFLLHPVCVESVAWISEQKNTLSAVLYLCAALAYLKWYSALGDATPESGSPRRTISASGSDGAGVAAPGAGRIRPIAWYAIASFLFLAALLTKTVTATLPAALWVILWWKHGRLEWRRDIVPLLPWLVLGAACGLFTAHFERELIGARGADFALGALDRCVLAGRVFWFYLGKLIWPANLVFNYPRWRIDDAVIDNWLGLVAGVAFLAALVWFARRRAGADKKDSSLHQGEKRQVGPDSSSRLSDRARRSPLAALLLFGGTLFPVLGFFDVYPFRHSYVADHFQYLATLAIFALVGAGLTRLQQAKQDATRTGVNAPGYNRRRLQPALRIVPVAVLGILGSLTFLQARVYHDVFSLYETTLARNRASWLAHNNLAIALTDADRVSEAVPHFQAALKLKPDFAQAENNLGDCLVRLGRVAEAIPHFERALHLEPRYAVARRNLGMALAMSGRAEEAVTHFAQAVKIEPTYAEAELYWAVALAQAGRPSEAIPHFERVLELVPSSGDAHLGLAEALRQLGRNDDAQKHFQAAQQLGVQ